MEFTCRYMLEIAIIAILMAAFVTVFCVYGIKPDSFKYLLNDDYTKIVKGKTTYVSVGKLNEEESLKKVGEKLSLIVGRKLDNYDNYDIYALKGKSTKDLIVVEYKNGNRMLFANQDLVNNPPEIDEEFYDKVEEQQNNKKLFDKDIKLNTIIDWDDIDDNVKNLIILSALGTAVFYVVF